MFWVVDCLLLVLLVCFVVVLLLFVYCCPWLFWLLVVLRFVLPVIVAVCRFWRVCLFGCRYYLLVFGWIAVSGC